MTHLNLAGVEHGPSSEEVGHHGRRQDGTSPMFVDSDGTWVGVEALVRVDFGHELVVDERNGR